MFEPLTNLTEVLPALLLLVMAVAGYRTGQLVFRPTWGKLQSSARWCLALLGVAALIITAELVAVGALWSFGWAFAQNRVIVALPLILMPAAGAAILAAPRLWRIAWIRIADPQAPVGAESRAMASAPCLVVPIQAVVDMFGIADLSDFDDASPFGQFVLRNTFGNSTEVRRSASPITYVAPGAPPFLILQGSDDPMVRPRQSVLLAQRLHSAGVRATLLEVQGTEHTLNTPGQRPSPDELTAAASDFFTAALR